MEIVKTIEKKAYADRKADQEEAEAYREQMLAEIRADRKTDREELKRMTNAT
jgi:hypothetical protein